MSLVSICHAPLSPTPSCKYLHPAVPVPATSGHCNKTSKRKTLKQKCVFGFIILEILTLSQLALSPWICGETENHDGGDRGNGSGHGDQEAESSVALTGRFPSPSRPPSYRTGLPIFKADLSPCNFCLICQSPLGSVLYKTPRCFQPRQVANQDEPLHSLLLTRLAFGVG